MKRNSIYLIAVVLSFFLGNVKTITQTHAQSLPAPSGTTVDSAIWQKRFLEVTNLKLAVDPKSLAVGANFMTASVTEADQGDTDLIGDMDTLDTVVHLLGNSENVPNNLLAAALIENDGDVQIKNDIMAYRVSEMGMGVDFNDDGDFDDTYLQIIDFSGVGGSFQAVLLSAEEFKIDSLTQTIAFTVDEQKQDQKDLNGDGDAKDFVLHVHDVTSLTTTNVGVAASSFQIENGIVAFTVNEADEGGVDLNGDTDSVDPVLHVYNVDSDQTDNLGLATDKYLLKDGILGFSVPELKQTADLNGDGVIGDEVMHVHDPSSALSSSNPLNFAFATFFDFAIESNLLVFTVWEVFQNQDVDGDGDQLDTIPHIYNPLTGQLEMLDVSVSGYFEFNGEYLLYTLNESIENNDLNGDLDQNDNVVHITNVNTKETTNLGVSSIGQDPQLELGIKNAFVSVRELDQGKTDLNGDQDWADNVLHEYDIEAKQLTNLGFASWYFELFDDVLVFDVYELDQGNSDLNEDDDGFDWVFHVRILNDVFNQTFNLKLARSLLTTKFKFFGEYLNIVVSEQYQGNADLNGDGDSLDQSVWHKVKILH